MHAWDCGELDRMHGKGPRGWVGSWVPGGETVLPELAVLLLPLRRALRVLGDRGLRRPWERKRRAAGPGHRHLLPPGAAPPRPGPVPPPHLLHVAVAAAAAAAGSSFLALMVAAALVSLHAAAAPVVVLVHLLLLLVVVAARAAAAAGRGVGGRAARVRARLRHALAVAVLHAAVGHGAGPR
uniref:Uncharacterized protein n=1 Tax=Zea mays TaxID=4577 RepID=A0A804QHS8_MAIZE